MAVEMNKNPLGSPTVLTAILWGATRQLSSRALLQPSDADKLMDAIDDSDQETVLDFGASMIACFYGMDKQEWVDILKGEVAEPEEDEEAADPESEEAPKAPKNSSGSGSRSRSGAGKSSS